MTKITKPAQEILERAQGCLLGQLAGDALGSLVEFQTPEQIQRDYPDGLVRTCRRRDLEHNRRPANR